jgi:hypothetical protein
MKGEGAMFVALGLLWQLWAGVNEIRDLWAMPSGEVRIELYSSAKFEPRGELPVLSIGERDFLVSGYGPDGDLHTIYFTLTAEEFRQLKDGDAVTVHYGRDPSAPRREFGRLSKARLRQQ